MKKESQGIMHIYPIESLKLSTDQALLSNDKLSNLSYCFWREIFNTSNVIELLEFSSIFESDKKKSKIVKSFLSSQSIESELEKAILNVTGIGIKNSIYFNSIEIIDYLLYLFSEYYYNKIPFTINGAFEIFTNSSKKITDLAKNTKINPYHYFLEKHFVPVLKEKEPNFVFVNGKPGLSNFSQLFFVKKLFPKASVFITKHSTDEFYSLNKIVEYLKTNVSLFSWIDGIILDDFKYTENLIQKSDKNNDLMNIPNMLLKTSTGIKQTEYRKREKEFSENVVPVPKIVIKISEKITDIRELHSTTLLINNKCYWNACTYCGINNRYLSKTNSSLNKIKEYVAFFDKVNEMNYKLLLLQDEAIPVELVNKIAIEKSAKNNNLAWHFRSRITTDFTDEVICNLTKSNLKGIIWGVESVNKRIIGLMNKYNEFIEPEFIEKLVDKLFENHIHSHFNIMIGFPSETREEIEETLQFVSKIKTKHPDFTFVINIFQLDISSRIFTNKVKYNLATRIPVPKKYYIGNNFNFNRDISLNELFNIKFRFLFDNIPDIRSNVYLLEAHEDLNNLINFINKRVSSQKTPLLQQDKEKLNMKNSD